MASHEDQCIVGRREAGGERRPRRSGHRPGTRPRTRAEQRAPPPDSSACRTLRARGGRRHRPGAWRRPDGAAPGRRAGASRPRSRRPAHPERTLHPRPLDRLAPRSGPRVATAIRVRSAGGNAPAAGYGRRPGSADPRGRRGAQGPDRPPRGRWRPLDGDPRRPAALDSAYRRSRRPSRSRNRSLAQPRPESSVHRLTADLDDQLARSAPAPIGWTLSRCHASIMPTGAYPGIYAAFHSADRPGSATPHREPSVHGLPTTTGGGAGRVRPASPDIPGDRRTADVVTGCTEAPSGAVPSVAVVTRCTRHEDGGAARRGTGRSDTPG